MDLKRPVVDYQAEDDQVLLRQRRRLHTWPFLFVVFVFSCVILGGLFRPLLPSSHHACSQSLSLQQRAGEILDENPLIGLCILQS